MDQSLFEIYDGYIGVDVVCDKVWVAASVLWSKWSEGEKIDLCVTYTM